MNRCTFHFTYLKFRVKQTLFVCFFYKQRSQYHDNKVQGTSSEFSPRSACHMKTSNRSVLRRISANMLRVHWCSLPLSVLCFIGFSVWIAKANAGGLNLPFISKLSHSFKIYFSYLYFVVL